ncbi:MAG: DUF1707 SHOCT-like domain-containing protein [Propionibacteriaceae bacterium]
MTTTREWAGPLRIGDAERDRAVSVLADHFAAGRLEKDEYEERVAAALAAVHQHDLAPLFADLPGAAGPAGPQVPAGVGPRELVHRRSATGPARAHGGPPWPVLFVPLLALVLVAIVASAPWVLFLGFWVVCLGGGRVTGCRSGRRAPRGSDHGGHWRR